MLISLIFFVSCIFRGGGHFDERQFETYGLSVKFLEGLGIQGPLHTKVFVANVSIFLRQQV